MTSVLPAFTENALNVLERRYLLPGETPSDMLRRASFGNEDYFNALASLDLLPNSPTLFNAGTGHGTLSACFKFDIDDSMESIIDVSRKAILVQKWGGGVGYVLSALRPRGAPISTTHGFACGPIEVLKKLHADSQMVTQGGKRAGAQMGILSCDHPDLLEFVHCKDIDPQSLSTFNISVAATDKWMNEQLEQEAYALHSSVLWEMAESAWKTGDPGLYFIDTSERTNPTPWLGQLTGTNPCGEVPLLNNEPCNLGSINLGHMVKPAGGYFIGNTNIVSKYEIDWEKLEATTRLGTRFLDDVLDHNQFPDPKITTAAFLTRKLGLGVMGLADLFALLHVHYDTMEAVALSDELSAKINGWALDESIKLGKEKGVCPSFDQLWSIDPENADFYTGQAIEARLAREASTLPRNSTRTCIAPTGTISILVGASSSIEPHFALTWTRYMNDRGTDIPIEESVPVLDKCGDFVPKTAMEIDWQWHTKHQAAWQANIDLAVSKTINMAESVTVQDVFDAYVMAWQTGCKGATIYRDNCRDFQVLNTSPRGSTAIDTDTLMAVAQTLEQAINRRRKLPVERPAVNHKFNVGDQEGYINVGLYDDGSPGELFITASKEGSTTRGLLDTIGILTSLCLQYGVPLDSLTSKMQGITFEPNGLTGNPIISTASSMIDYIFHWMRHRFLPATLEDGHHDQIGTMVVRASLTTGLLCPECGSMAISQEGCMLCSNPSCGWSRC